MAKKISGVIAGVSMLLAVGIVGGIEHGAPLHNAVWAIVCIAVFGL